MLFRRQAVAAQEVRLYGKVLVVSPIRFWVITSFLVLLVAVIVSFAFTVSFSRIETVQGAVVPTAGIVRVTAPSAGRLEGFEVTEGQGILAGQVLGRIVAPNLALDAAGTRTGVQLANVSNRLADVENRRSQSAVVRDLDLARNAREIAEIEARLGNARAMLEFQTILLAEAQAARDRTAQLSDRNLVNAETMSRKNIELISARRELASLQGEIETLTLQKENAGFARLQIDARAKLEAIEFDAEVTALNAERQLLLAREDFEVIAPANGTASAVLVGNEHQVQTSTVLFSILPEESTLEVELYVPSRAIGFVEEGQRVSLLFDAFPYQRFGSQSGTIREVTGSVILPDSAGLLVSLTEPVYRVTVALDRQTVNASGRSMRVQPGMLLQANIILEDRRVVEWLIEPLISVIRRS